MTKNIDIGAIVPKNNQPDFPTPQWLQEERFCKWLEHVHSEAIRWSLNGGIRVSNEFLEAIVYEIEKADERISQRHLFDGKPETEKSTQPNDVQRR